MRTASARCCTPSLFRMCLMCVLTVWIDRYIASAISELLSSDDTWRSTSSSRALECFSQAGILS